MNLSSPSLVGSIVERKPGSSPPTVSSGGITKSKFLQSSRNGFPAAQHRSQSAFSRSRQQRDDANSKRSSQVPTVSRISVPSSSGPSEEWRRQAEEENMRRVESMTEEERESERREILEKFGPGIGDVLKRARQKRVIPPSEEPEGPPSEDLPELPSVVEARPPSSPRPPRPSRETERPKKSALASRPASPIPASDSAGSTRPSSRADRRLRFADVTVGDVHVYDSAPPSPRRKPLALMAPSDDDGPTVSLGQYKGPALLAGPSIPEPAGGSATADEEGTPNDIRRRFFPSANPDEPSIEWMQPLNAKPAQNDTPDRSLRFDLNGSLIPPELSSTLPTHLGLHHHAEGSHAGYTLDDIFLLSRSTVPGQRASMLDVLARIAKRLAKNVRQIDGGIPELVGQEKDLRKRILAAGIEAMGERGSVGPRAIEAMWVCLVHWDEEVAGTSGFELKDVSNDIVSTVPLDLVLPQLASAFGAAALPSETLYQLLAITHRLAQHSNEIADTIVSTPKLVANFTQYFLLTPIPPKDTTSYPEPFALEVLITLASSSRANATTLTDLTDALLRFVVTLPPSSPYPLPLATTLLSSTFRLYTVLASYGLYSQIATTAFEHIHAVSAYIISPECRSTQLKDSWLSLLEAWMVCARDPHRTTPDHDILWSQVVGWGWADDIRGVRKSLIIENPETWAASWRAEAAWLEGSSVNGVKGGEAEKAVALELLRPAFESGDEHIVVENCMRSLRAGLQELQAIVDIASPNHIASLQEVSKQAGILASVVRLWLSCLPSGSQEPLQSPPFSLPFSQISDLCALLATHPLWSRLSAPNAPISSHMSYRPLSQLLSVYLDLSRVLPGTSDDLWMAQALTVLPHLLPGNEEFAVRVINTISSLIAPEFMTSRNWHVPPAIWEKKGLEPITPFLTYALRSSPVRIGSTWMTPYSISASTAQRLVPLSQLLKSSSDVALPMLRTWIFSPLDHLLRSGQSGIFKSLPADWDASETEVVRATFLLARVCREVLKVQGLRDAMLSREEAVFNCMKVFMLEHEQQQEDSTAEEVFRDTIVGEFMNDLLAPFTISKSPSDSPPSQATSELKPPLEIAASQFLGASTPFYQFYTDFVGLYDSISFSHPIFARLLLPPLSMRYPHDYRKYLWGDFNHILKTVKTPVENVVASSVEEYLWPLETNPDVVGGYIRALVKGQLEGFVRLVAIHHISCGIWPDLREDKGEKANEKAATLLQAVVSQAGLDVIREVVLYRAKGDGDVTLLPPRCFEEVGSWKAERLEFVRERNAGLLERLRGLLSNS